MASHLGIETFPGPWSYFDLRTNDGFTVSVKQSVGATGRFDVSGKVNAWDNGLVSGGQGVDHKAQGWLHNESGEPRRWCDIWIFGHLDTQSLDEVCDPNAWQFATVSRRWLDDALPSLKSVTHTRLVDLGVEFGHGSRIAPSVERAKLELAGPANWRSGSVH